MKPNYNVHVREAAIDVMFKAPDEDGVEFLAPPECPEYRGLVKVICLAHGQINHVNELLTTGGGRMAYITRTHLYLALIETKKLMAEPFKGWNIARIKLGDVNNEAWKKKTVATMCDMGFNLDRCELQLDPDNAEKGDSKS